MFTHLTLDDRITIQQGLKEGKSFKAIGLETAKDGSTISKEIKRSIEFKKTGCHGSNYNACLIKRDCSYRKICNKPDCKTKYCKNCTICNKHCSSFVEKICYKKDKPPYVCNGCESLNKCALEKKFYKAHSAHDAYKEILSESRSGVAITKTELAQLNGLISPLIKQGQSIHHVYSNNSAEMIVGERTLYNYFDYNLFSAINLDLPRKVRLRKRKKTKEHKVDKKCCINRKLEDYKRFLEENNSPSVVQMDTVEGIKGEKVLLTIHFVAAKFMLAFIRDRNTAQSVTEVFNYLYDLLGHDDFVRLFPLLLTDNGSEFSDPVSVEFNKSGGRRTWVFYCDPNASYQKGAAENNHEFIRRIIPKGKSFKHLIQNDVNLMMNHINSYTRKDLNDKSPRQVFEFMFGRDILEKLGCECISPNDIILKPSLLK